MVGGLLRGKVLGLRKVVTPDVLPAPEGPDPRPRLHAQDTALLQYTSGSTGDPKGVLLTHANLLANIGAMAEVARVEQSDVFVSWLPLYHDMGLIGDLARCMHPGLSVGVESPLSFLTRPARWLWAIHERRATLSAAPNFGFEFCVTSPTADRGDRSVWSWLCVALNGAEPVSPDTVERFAKRFERYGFRREALAPCTGWPRTRSHSRSRRWIGDPGSTGSIVSASSGTGGRCPLLGGIPLPCGSSRAAHLLPVIVCASSTSPVPRSGVARRAASSPRARQPPVATSATPRRPVGCSMGTGSTPATSGTSPTAICS